MKILAIVLPAVGLGVVGFYLGYYAKDSLEGAIASTLAGVLGGGVAGYAALGVVYRAQVNRRDRATQP